MLVDGYKEMKPYLPAVEMKGTPDIFDDALEVAQDRLVADIIGTDLEARLELRKEEDRKLLRLCQRAVSQDAFLQSIPDMDLVLTDAGFAVTNNDQMTMASRDRVTALTTNMQAKVDASRDALVMWLMKHCDDWRGSEEFGRLSDALIMTFAEFRDLAVLNNITATAYPHSWSEFISLNSALNVALMTDVASYIGKDYAEELVEKTRDEEAFHPSELKALKLIKIAMCAFALGDRATGIDQTVKAVQVMKADPDSFPTFTASAESLAVDITHEDTPIFSLL